jgi:hypothetical protein
MSFMNLITRATKKVFKYYLSYENKRNSHHQEMFVWIIKRAFGCKEVVLVGHHFVCDYNSDLKTLNEIPSADTLLFDHDIMKECFGERSIEIMIELAKRPVPERDEYLRSQIPDLPAKTDWWEMPKITSSADV